MTVYTCASMYMDICTLIDVYTYSYTNINVHKSCIYMHICAYAWLYIHMHIHIYIWIQSNIHSRKIHAHLSDCINMQIIIAKTRYTSVRFLCERQCTHIIRKNLKTIIFHVCVCIAHLGVEFRYSIPIHPFIYIHATHVAFFLTHIHSQA